MSKVFFLSTFYPQIDFMFGVAQTRLSTSKCSVRPPRRPISLASQVFPRHPGMARGLGPMVPYSASRRPQYLETRLVQPDRAMRRGHLPLKYIQMRILLPRSHSLSFFTSLKRAVERRSFLNCRLFANYFICPLIIVKGGKSRFSTVPS